MSNVKKLLFEEPAEAPPPDWSPLDASDKDLQKYIYPPRPDQSTEPLAYALWEDFALRKPKYVAAGPVEIESLSGESETRNWAGAVVPPSALDSSVPTQDDQRFDRVEGRWKIPVVKPSPKEGPWVDGKYELWTWVGIDGFQNDVHVRAGVKTEFSYTQPNDSVVKNNDIVVKNTAVVVFRRSPPGSVWAFNNFHVNTGDEVHLHVWGDVTKPASINATIWNITRGLWSTVDTGSLEQLEGLSAQWILSGPNPGPEFHFPTFEDVKYLDLVAHRIDGKEVGSEDSGTTNAKENPVTVHKLEPNRLLFENVSSSEG